MTCVLRALLLFATISFGPVVTFAHLGACSHKILNSTDETSDTAEFNFYLTKLVQKNVISLSQLQSFIVQLESSQLTNPISNPNNNKIQQIHYDQIESILATSTLDIPFIRTFAKSLLESNSQLTEQKKTTETNTSEIPIHTSRSGAMLYPFIHPVLGPAIKILKPRGFAHQPKDWEPTVWALEPRYVIDQHPIRITNHGSIDPKNKKLISKESDARAVCIHMGPNIDLPTESDYEHLLSLFDHTLTKDRSIGLTHTGILEFQRTFPHSDQTFWTSSVHREFLSKERVKIFLGKLGHMGQQYRSFEFGVRCITTVDWETFTP